MSLTRFPCVAVLLVGMALVAAGCGGKDAQQAAQTKVCDARAEIRKSVDTLQSMTPATFTADAVRTQLDSIKSSLQTISDAQGDLSSQRQSELKDANQQFKAQIRDIGGTILKSTSVAEARTQVQAAVQQLGGVYRSTLAKVSCD